MLLQLVLLVVGRRSGRELSGRSDAAAVCKDVCGRVEIHVVGVIMVVLLVVHILVIVFHIGVGFGLAKLSVLGHVHGCGCSCCRGGNVELVHHYTFVVLGLLDLVGRRLVQVGLWWSTATPRRGTWHGAALYYFVGAATSRRSHDAVHGMGAPSSNGLLGTRKAYRSSN
jgi:hypothetical protein